MASTHGYATVTDLKRIIPNIEQSTEFDTDSEIEAFISEAEELVNSMLSVRYTVPFTGTIPPIITYITVRITAYNMLKTEYTEDGVNINQWVIEYYNKAMKIIDRIIERKMKLVDGSGADLAEVTAIKTHRGNFTPISDIDDELDHKVDGDLTDEINSERL